MSKSDLFYSKYCKHSIHILNIIEKSEVKDNFNYICIDKRFTKDNIVHITMMDGSTIQLPPMINRVPVLLLKPNYELLSGNQIIDYIQPQSNSLSEEKQNILNEPETFSIGKDNSMTGVMSDNFSFLDMSNEELSATGNGGIRQLYHYAQLDSNPTIETPMNEEKSKKLNTSIEQLQEKRNNELNIN